NHRWIHGVIRPIERVRPDARLAADGDATYPSASAAARTRSRVEEVTLGSPRSARDTVAVETPAARATSSIPAVMARIVLLAPWTGPPGSLEPTPTNPTCQSLSTLEAVQRLTRRVD